MIANLIPIEETAYARYFEERGEKREKKRGIVDHLNLIAMLHERGKLTHDECAELIAPLEQRLSELSAELPAVQDEGDDNDRERHVTTGRQ